MGAAPCLHTSSSSCLVRSRDTFLSSAAFDARASRSSSAARAACEEGKGKGPDEGVFLSLLAAKSTCSIVAARQPAPCVRSVKTQHTRCTHDRSTHVHACVHDCVCTRLWTAADTTACMHNIVGSRAHHRACMQRTIMRRPRRPRTASDTIPTTGRRSVACTGTSGPSPCACGGGCGTSTSTSRGSRLGVVGQC